VSDYTEFTDEQENDSQLAKDLRAQIKALGAENRVLKAADETHKVEARATTVSDLLKAQKRDPKVARFVPKDVDATEEAITKWLAGEGDVFGVLTDASTDDDSSGEGVSPETLAALARAQAAEHAGGVSAPVGVDARLAELKSYEGKSFDEITRLLT
jgi:hypothetical protein